jgi:putative protease
MTTPTTPELLAPAGDWEALRAAVANGADAVYFGLSAFNARARAHNFTLDELPEVMHFLHTRNVRGFVTLNVLIFSDELEEASRFVVACANAGVDAVIVQDLGLVRLIRAIAPTLPVHASTQMTLTEPRGIEFVRRLGVERVVLARELSLDEIRKVTAGTDAPVEVFVHGALCVAYSGQCLTSEALGGRSANRGQCAQACRLPYEMIVDGQPCDLGDKAYLLSPQDLAAYELIQPLIKAGVISFKIEGRLKGGPYVAATTQTYRIAIDAALADQRLSLSRKQELDLAQTFSRGLTHGFLDGVNHQMLVRGRFPKSRGVKLGTVDGFSAHGVKVRLAERLPVAELIRPGDGVLFDLGTPEVQEPGGRVWKVDLAKPSSGRASPGENIVVAIIFEPGAVDIARIPVGCDVWKTDDPELKKRLTQTYSQDKLARREPLTAVLGGAVGRAVTLTLTTNTGVSASASWPGPLEVASKRATTADEMRDQLARLGDTPFELAEFVTALPPGVLVPKSVLNDLRRKAAAELVKRRELTHAVQEPNALKRLRTEAVSSTSHFEINIPQLTVLVRSLVQLEAVLPLRPAVVYCDFEDLRRYKEAVAKARAARVSVGLATNRIWKPGEDGFQSLVVRADPDLVLVRNLAGIEYFKQELPHAQLVGDFSLNVANDLTADLLRCEGLVRLVPSFDLNWGQFTALMEHADPALFEPVVHQHMPMFHMEHCVFAAFLSAGKDHRDCGRPCDAHRVELRDRVGACFPVHPDTGCRNTVFNSVPQSAAEYVGRMKELGIRWFRIDLLRETPEEAVRLVEQYRRVIAGMDDGQQTWRQLKALNQLGVTRGTLNLL